LLGLNFRLESNCNIEVKVNRLKAGICDFSLKGVLRIVLSPLLEDLPLVGAATIAFVEEPVSFGIPNFLKHLSDWCKISVL